MKDILDQSKPEIARCCMMCDHAEAAVQFDVLAAVVFDVHFHKSYSLTKGAVMTILSFLGQTARN